MSARQKILRTDLSLCDRLLKIPERCVDEFVTSKGANDPALRFSTARTRENLELMATARAFDRRSALGNQRVVEVIFGATAAAANVHRVFFERRKSDTS
jgi:hypothetical protein